LVFEERIAERAKALPFGAERPAGELFGRLAAMSVLRLDTAQVATPMRIARLCF
jgi:hypothetical protein